MQATKIIHQRPCPQILIKRPSDGEVKLTFHQQDISSLQSFNFSLSTDDITGSFNLLFFPDNFKKTLADGKAKTTALFDEIELLDIVEIYEDYPVVNQASGETKNIAPATPIFTGVIRSKKYAASGGDSGVMRRMSVSGTAITGLVSQFKISLDVTAQAIKEVAKTNEEFNSRFVDKNKEDGATEIKDIILNAWELFLELSKDTGNPEIADYITKFMGEPEEFFDIESTTIGYPLAGIFPAETTQDFFSIADEILPPPYYERTAYTDSEGKMKIRMRRCPFDAADWAAITPITIDNTRVKSFDITQSDNEVYSVFFAYLEGSPQSEREYLITAINETKENGLIVVDDVKYGKYGYRPLFIHFRGYKPTDSDEDTASDAKMKEATEQIASWYGNLDEMLSGTITLAMTYRNDTDRIMPGDVVNFLGGQFYVDGVSHSWTYNGGGEISLSVSRGGIYDENGNWSKFDDVTSYMRVRGTSNESAG